MSFSYLVRSDQFIMYEAAAKVAQTCVYVCDKRARMNNKMVSQRLHVCFKESNSNLWVYKGNIEVPKQTFTLISNDFRLYKSIKKYLSSHCVHYAFSVFSSYNKVNCHIFVGQNSTFGFFTLSCPFWLQRKQDGDVQNAKLEA